MLLLQAQKKADYNIIFLYNQICIKRGPSGNALGSVHLIYTGCPPVSFTINKEMINCALVSEKGPPLNTVSALYRFDCISEN